jgi:hypothetical protein
MQKAIIILFLLQQQQLLRFRLKIKKAAQPLYVVVKPPI